MTIYQKELLSMLKARYGRLTAGELAGKLFEIGVLDPTLCKVLAVREYVSGLMAGGRKKFAAMWMASEHFCCSYEYIRKCVYYYTDVNLV